MKERAVLALEADPELLDQWLRELGFERTADQTRAHLFPRLLRWEKGASSVTWVEDHTVGVRCVEVRGVVPKLPVPVLSLDQLLERSGRDADARRALEYLRATEIEFWRSDGV
jgi:hypothetical protein